MSSGLLREAEDMHEKLSSWRRTLHQNPEAGLSLPETVKFVKEQLEEAGVECRVYDECSCVTAQIGKGGSCFLLRSDMDALPMKEESRESFASQNGCMHSCGHDLHTAILLGAARLLKAHEHELKGTVKLLFQSGEEIFEGAQAAIDAGALEDPHVDAAFAMHVASTMTSNLVIYGRHQHHICQHPVRSQRFLQDTAPVLCACSRERHICHRSHNASCIDSYYELVPEKAGAGYQHRYIWVS